MENDENKLTREEKELCDKVITAFRKKLEVDCIHFEAVRVEKMTPYESKIGGTPYLPRGFQYPYSILNGSEGKPMKLLAQLNFEDLPKLEYFPQKGILQFYIACDENDDLCGADFDYPTKQNGFRIMYHSNILEKEGDLQISPKFSEKSKDYIPFDGEFKIVATIGRNIMGCNDFRFEKQFMPVYIEVTGENQEKYRDLSNEMLDYIWQCH